MNEVRGAKRLLAMLSGLALTAGLLVSCGIADHQLPNTSPSSAISTHTPGDEITDAEWKVVVAKVLPSIVHIIGHGCGENWTGSGFSVGNYLVTNEHMVHNMKSLEIITPKNGTFVATSWLYSKADDLALIDISNHPIAALPLAAQDSITGDSIATGGYPGGGPQVSERGILVSKEIGPVGDSLTFVWLTTANVHAGDSGGPMISVKGTVAGVMYAVEQDNTHTIAIPVSRLRATLDDISSLKTGIPCRD